MVNGDGVGVGVGVMRVIGVSVSAAVGQHRGRVRVITLVCEEPNSARQPAGMLGSPIRWHPLCSRARTAKCKVSFARKRTGDTTRTTNNPKDKPFSKYAKDVLQTRAGGGCQGKCAVNVSVGAT